MNCETLSLIHYYQMVLVAIVWDSYRAHLCRTSPQQHWAINKEEAKYRSIWIKIYTRIYKILAKLLVEFLKLFGMFCFISKYSINAISLELCKADLYNMSLSRQSSSTKPYRRCDGKFVINFQSDLTLTYRIPNVKFHGSMPYLCRPLLLYLQVVWEKNKVMRLIIKVVLLFILGFSKASLFIKCKKCSIVLVSLIWT